MSQVEEGLTSSKDDDINQSIRLKDAYKQIIASCISFTLVIQVGTSLSFTSVLLPQLDEKTSNIRISTDQGSWIASLVTLMIPVGSLLAGPLMDKYGRKKLSAISGLPFALGWIIAALASNVIHLYVSRILIGLAAGFSTVCLVYCSEITHPNYRPMLLGLNSVFVSLGILITCALGVSVPWRIQAYIYCGLSLITVILHYPLPESPYWLSSYVDAQKSIKWLYIQKNAYQSQLRILQKEREHRALTTNTSNLKTCLEPVVYKPVILLIWIFLFQQLTGAYAVIFYAVDIFRELKAEYEDFILIMFGAIRFIMAFVSLLLSRVFGRRPLLFLSGIGMSLSCLTTFLLLQFHGNSVLTSVLVLSYVCFGALGILGIPWTLIGELIPVKVKGLISGFMITTAYIFMFCLVKIFPILIDQIDIRYIFVIFSVNSFIVVLIIYFWLPETLGVKFSDIETCFRS